MTIVSIKKGNTLGAMVRDYNKAHGTKLTVAQVQQANGLRNANQIRAGGKVLFPDQFEAKARPSVFQNGDHRPVVRNGVKEQVDVKATDDTVTTSAPALSTDLRLRPLEALPTAPTAEPAFPGPWSTEEDLMKFEQDFAAYAATQPKTAAQQTGLAFPRIPAATAPVSEKLGFQAKVLGYLAGLEAQGLKAPANATQPAWPGPNADASQVARYAAQAQQYASLMEPKPQTATAAANATIAASVQASGARGTIEDRALAGLSALEMPAEPKPGATEGELAKYQRDLGKYNRMFEMYSKIMANSHEMKKALIANLPR